MGRPRKEAPVGPTDITYLPGDGDPVSVKWKGFVFHANAPKTVTDGELIEMARGNRFFRVGQFDPKDAGQASDNGTPQDSRSYRAHVVAWLKNVSTVEDFVQRWAGDAHLRELCEVGSDDLDYLATLIEPRLHEMTTAEEMNKIKLSELFMRYGVTEVPWQVSRPTTVEAA